jgi:sporulation protein YlmC with PRC-barrel domain
MQIIVLIYQVYQEKILTIQFQNIKKIKAYIIVRLLSLNHKKKVKYKIKNYI